MTDRNAIEATRDERVADLRKPRTLPPPTVDSMHEDAEMELERIIGSHAVDSRPDIGLLFQALKEMIGDRLESAYWMGRRDEEDIRKEAPQ